ncbi:hypothetical protein PTSG_12420 [Salpingoeca rosetta]|uniref:VWFA domain-containing protein n=1 Tax=Salpingoeca rosetta (strain ATCC 50818 / BSB-021) TaxID=946362 RepID=F2UCF0_SALR5|nr:uncharacterized protein PTSG_12420 [Salpingoeca rosetta]EGD74257.1 hypothetical protein PTSG_12420 [Salpingoeca rosetta]|eukprot:XP_004993157.1 hypothetical protein PTSG_12420 [Salpingoeca rosetta]
MPRPPAAAQRAGSASTKSTRSTKSRRELATGASSSERVRGRRQHRSEPRKEEAKKPHRQQQRPPFTLEFTEAARSPSPRGRRHGTASQSPSRHTLQKAADSDVWKLRVPSKEWLEKYGLGKLALPFEHHLSRRHKAKLERRRNRLPQRHGAPSSDDSDSDDDRDTGDDDADETGAAKRTHVHGGKAEAESEDKLDEDELAALHVSDLKEAHAKTTACRQLVQQRLDWLLEGSRAHFGALTGVQTAIIIADDHSDKRRLVDLLCELLEDQVLLHPSMQWIRATASAAIHHFMPDTKESSLNQVFNWLQQQAPFAPALTGQEARKSVASLTPAQTRAHQSATFSSLLKGLTIRSRSSSPHGISAGYREDGIDVCRAVDAALDHHPRPRRIHLILGSPPRRSDEQVLDHVRRALARAGQHVRLDVVCTHAQNRRLLQLAHQLAKVGRGRRHVLNVESGELWSDDVRAVQRHLTRATKTERAVETALKEAVRIAHVQQLAEDDRRRETKQRTQPRRGGGGGGRRREAGGRANKGWIVGDTRSSRLRMKQRDGDRTHDKPTTATRRVRRDKRDLSRVPAHDVPPHLLGSTRWLHKYGLDVRGLSPYTVFADVAYTCSKPGLYIGREYKTMCKVMWTDGAERTVHIDPARVLILRRQIAVAKDLYTRRLNWLGTGSRRLFPSMQESVVTIVVEANAKTQKSWPLLLAHIKAALQEQVVHRSHFNVVLYGAHAHKFSPDVVPASKSSIRHAWEWIKYFDIEDSKANNIYDAAKAAIDNLRPQRHGTEHGIYWVTASGNSQKSEPTIAYIREILAEGHTHMHMLSYNAHHVERTRELHQQLAEAGGGRYQFVHEEGTALDEAHRQDKSWTATQEAVAAIAAKFKTKDSAESRALWKKARNAHITQNPGSIAELHGPPTLSLDSLRKQQYAVLSTWMHQRTRTALHDALRSDALDESGSAEVVCKSCGTDTLLLQQEIARADEYVSVLDGMLTALPAEYALAAFKTAEKRGETVPAHIAEELRRRRQEEVQQQLDREQRNSADDDDGRGGAGSSADEGGGSARSEGMRSETGKDSRLAQARTQTTTTIPNTGGTNRGGGRSERTQQLSTAAGGGAGGRARAKTLRHGVPAHVPLTRSTQLRQQQLERRKKNNEKGAGDAVRPFTARSAPHTRGHRSAATTAENSTSSSSGIGCGSSRRANSAGTKKRAVAKQHSSSDSARSRRYMLINTPAEMTGPQRGPAVPADAGDNVTVPGLAKAPVDMPCTSKKWLAKCSLKKLRLTMDAFLATNSLLHEEQHVSTLARNVQGEFGSLFPVKTHTNIKSKKNAGACWYVMAKPQEFSEYLSKLSRVLTHYEQRLAWLTDGYRRVFGHFQCKVVLEKEIRAVKICMRRAHELKEAVASSVGRKQEPVDSDDSTDGKQQQQQLQRQKKSTGGQSCDTTTASTAATEGLDADMRRLLRLRDRARAAGARRLRDDDEEDDGDDDGDDDDDDDDDDGDDDGDGDDDDDDDGDGDDNNDSAVLSRQMTRTPRSTRSTQLRRMVTELRYKEEGEEEGNEHERRGGRTAGRNQAPSDGDDQDSDSGDDDGDGDDRHADERAWEHEGHLIDDDAGLNYNDIMRAVGRRAASSPPHHHRHADAESDAGSVDTSRLHSHNRTVRLLAGAMSDADIDDVVSDDDDDDDDRHGVHNRERRHNRATARPRPHNSRRHRPAGSVVLSNVPRLATEEDIVAMFRRRHLKPPFKVVIPWDDQREENVGTAYCFFHLLHDVTRAAQAKRLHLQGQTIFVAKRASKQDMLPHTSKALSESLLTVGSKAIHQHWFASSLASSSATL